MKRFVFVVCFLIIAAYIVASVRILHQKNSYYVLDSKLFSISPRIVAARLSLAPFPFLSLYRYPKEEKKVFLQDLEKPFRSKEGIEFFLEGSISFSFDKETVDRAHVFMKQHGFSPFTPEIFYGPIQAILASMTIPHPDMKVKWSQLNRDIQSAVTREMRDHCIVLESLTLDKIFFKNKTASGQRALKARVLLIGLDGADWNILNTLIEEERLPNLKRLAEKGSKGKLLTVTPSLSPIVWTSVATGKKPAKHGIVDFLAIDERNGKRIPVTSSIRKVKAFWNILSDAGIQVGVIGWWATWPAEKVNGYIVTDHIAYQLLDVTSTEDSTDDMVYPPDLYSLIRPLVVKAADVRWDEVKRFFGPQVTPESFSGEKRKLLEQFKTLYASTETYKNIFHYLDGKKSTDFEALYLEGTDTISHLFMRYRAPKIEGVNEEDIRNFGQTIDRYYEYIDGIMGEILRKKDDSWTIILCSDHGFKTGERRPVSYDARIELGKAALWHERYGILIASGKEIEIHGFVGEGSVLDILPTILALYGLPVGFDMDGRPLNEILAKGFLSDHPIRMIDSYEGGAATSASGKPVESNEDQLIREKLRSLGYISSESDNAFNNRGLELMSKADFDGAIRQFQTALSDNPSFMAARINLGVAYLQKRSLDDAIEIFEKVLVADPKNADVENYLGNAFMEKGNFRAAQEHFERALSNEPNFIDAVNSLGILYEKEGKLNIALEKYRRTVEIDPQYAEGYNNIGNILKALGRADEAISWYKKAIEADPSFMGSYNNIALILEERKDYEEAILYFNKALEQAPSNTIVMNNLGSLYFSEGDVDSAIVWWKKAIEISPHYASPYNNLGAAYGRKGMPDEEIDMYKRALIVDPLYSDARQNLGLALLRKGEFERGVEELKKLIASNPRDVRALIAIAHAYLGKNMNHEGLLYLEKALAAEPKNVLLLNMAGEVSTYLGDKEKAIGYFSRSLNADPDQKMVKMKIHSLSSQ